MSGLGEHTPALLKEVGLSEDIKARVAKPLIAEQS
jgi:hypothetical protein